jgi:hypothetical protein
MICDTCHGKGRVIRDASLAVGVMPGDPRYPVSIWEPCPDCGGCGIGHCCDGLRAQADDELP